ncbi:DUF3307 domain-containing protein [Exiguobacterium sp. s95]|uniref:DUF3307 domain-containing protein n=1 Tax=Exiguobacterium sp. s95 TaxID=2751211 RepID=UPI001BEC65E8|nr:DUF3307 domain-containing protein [Exiguobacterium sp. s95]
MNDDNSYKEEFLYKALEDGQNTIRFTDTKAAAVIAFWTFFISALISMKNMWIDNVTDMKSWAEVVLVCILIFTMINYLIRSITLAYTVLVPRNNPGSHIISEGIEGKGLFYIHGYNLPGPLNFKYLYKNHEELKLGKKTKDYIQEFKEISKIEVETEIVLELQKVSFIRNLKIDRVNESISLLMRFMIVFFIILIYFFVENSFNIKEISSLWNFNFNVELFIVLYIAHKIADYLFQTNNQALNKTQKWIPLLIHCVIYTLILTVLPYLILGFISWSAIIVIFITHVILDKGEFLNLWAKKIKRIENPNDTTVKLAMFELDQAFHYLVIFFVSFM